MSIVIGVEKDVRDRDPEISEDSTKSRQNDKRATRQIERDNTNQYVAII